MDAQKELIAKIGLNEMHWAVIHRDYAALENLLTHKTVRDGDKTNEMLFTKKSPKDSRIFIAGDFFFPPARVENFPLELNMDKGSCPVHFAAAMGDVEAIDLFIKYKSNLNIKDGVGATPLHLACVYGHLEAAQRLFNTKTKINEGTKTKKSLVFYDAGTTPLHAALATGKLDLLQWLLEQGADIHIKTKFGCDAYFFAARGGNSQIIRLLAGLGLQVPQQGVYRNFPLVEAVLKNSYETVAALLELGSPVAEPQGHQAPLSAAIENNYLDIRSLLIQYGAQPFDYKDNLGSAATHNDTTYIKAYDEEKKDLNIIKSGATALMMAAAHGRKEAVELLLALGVDVNLNPNGTALHYALDNQEYEIASILLDHHIDCSLVNEHGNNVLVRMVNANIPNRMNLCKKMLALGANPHSKSKHGVSAYSFAQTTGDTELLEIFDQVSTNEAIDLSYVPPTTSKVLQQLPATYNWKTVYQELWDELVPPSGPANSLQGELLRSIGKLSDEFFRNGNINWDHNKEFYLDLINLLKTHLLDGSITMDEKELKNALKKLTHFNVVYYPKTESPHDIIAEAVVQWCAAHTTFIPYKA